MTKNEPPTKTCYKPSPKIEAFLAERSELLKESEKPLFSKIATETEWREKERGLRKKKRASDKKKVEHLNKIIFPSMANIIFLLEAIAKNPELLEDFDDDLKDLFGFRFDPKLKHKGFVPPLRRFFDALFTWDDARDRSNFRLELLNSLQYWLFMKVHQLSLRELGSNLANEVVSGDMARAMAWTKMLARTAEKEGQEPSRPVKF